MGRATRLFFSILVLAQVSVLIVGLALALPWGMGPDEPPHLQYAAFLALEGSVDPAQHDVLQAQHPPLYHWIIGQLYARLRETGPSSEKSDHTLDTVPFYERRIELNALEVVPDPIHMSVQAAARSATPTPVYIRRGVLHVLRLTGLLFGLVTALMVLCSTRLTAGARAPLGLLAAGLVLLMPQFSAIFATVNNDQFAVLFGTAGFAVLARAARRGQLDAWRPLCLSGVLYLLGFFAKLLVFGSFAAGLGLLWFGAKRPLRTRLNSVLILGGLQFPIGFWILQKIEQTGSPHGLDVAAAQHPGLLRTVAPDAFGLLEIMGQLLESFTASAGGSPGVHPGTLWRAVAMIAPLLIIACALTAIVIRRASRTERAFGAAFLLGLLTQLLLIAYGNRAFVHNHGRYLYGLILPAALALTAGAPYFLGPHRARGIAALLLVVVAAGGPLLLHGQILPRFWPGHAIHQVKWIESYWDFGAPNGDRTLKNAVAAQELNWGYPRPRGRFAVTKDPNAPLEIPLGPLDANGFYLVSPFLHSPVPPLGPQMVINEDLLADGALVSGPLSAQVAPQWPSFPLPRGPLLDGSCSLLVRRLSGPVGCLSELLLRRLPLAYDGAVDSEEGLVVSFSSSDRDSLPPLFVQLRIAGTRVGPCNRLTTEDGRLTATLPWPPPGSGALELAVTLPMGPWADMKLAPLAAPDREVRGVPSSSGLSVIVLDGPAENRVAARVPLARFPRGSEYHIQLLDAKGEDISRSCALRIGGRELLAPQGFFTLEGMEAPTAPEPSLVEIVYRGGSPVLLDRLVAKTQRPFVFDLMRTR